MQKIKINQKSLENAKFTFNNQEIEVIPHMTYKNQEIAIKFYLQTYFDENSENRLNAEVINKVVILDLMTNIEVDEFEGDKLKEFLDGVVSSGLWEKITKSISNYREYLYNLDIALNSKKKENSDIAHVIQKFINEKINPLVEKFSSMDFTDEKLAEVKSLVGEIKEQLSPNTPAGSLISKGVV